jgi:hypothetical protein
MGKVLVRNDGTSTTVPGGTRGVPKQKTPLLQLAQTIKQAAETFGHNFPQAQLQNNRSFLSSAPVASRGQVFKSYCINSLVE